MGVAETQRTLHPKKTLHWHAQGLGQGNHLNVYDGALACLDPIDQDPSQIIKATSGQTTGQVFLSYDRPQPKPDFPHTLTHHI